VRKGGKIRRVEKLEQTMSRILHVIHEREQIKKQYRQQLESEYIQQKRAELENAISDQPDFPEITREMLRSKYEALRKGKDNVEYLEKICIHPLMKGSEMRMPNSEIKGQTSEP
jgi:hypothetical protein